MLANIATQERYTILRCLETFPLISFKLCITFLMIIKEYAVYFSYKLLIWCNKLVQIFFCDKYCIKR